MTPSKTQVRPRGPLPKRELAKKYRWEEWHGDGCECIYCVFMEMLSLQHEDQTPEAP